MAHSLIARVFAVAKRSVHPRDVGWRSARRVGIELSDRQVPPVALQRLDVSQIRGMRFGVVAPCTARRFEGLRQVGDVERRLRLIGAARVRVVDERRIGGNQKQIVRFRLARDVRALGVAQGVLLGERPVAGNIGRKVLLLHAAARALITRPRVGQLLASDTQESAEKQLSKV